MSHGYGHRRKAGVNIRIAAGAFLQLAALALLLFSGYLPLLNQGGGAESHAVHCLGSHDLCGCSPERIAAKTCCCSQRESSCCDTDAEEGAEVAQDDNHAGQPGLRAAPCGDGAKYLEPGTTELALNLAPSGRTAYDGWNELNYPRFRIKQPRGQTPEPPEPPPKGLQHA